jgi:EDD domain protein, DegV family
MEKIKLMTDTACDIPLEEAEKLGIDILSVLITAGDVTFLERREKSDEEFYEILKNSAEIPTTAAINPYEFQKAYEKHVEDGYNEIIFVSINAAGSSIYQSALTAKDMFYEEHEDLKENVHIHVLDSKSYTIAYGFPLLKAAKMVADGADVSDVLTFLQDMIDHNRIYFCVYTLDYAKRSGRISCAAAAVGGLLGIKPIMKAENSQITMAGKARSSKAALADICQKVVSEIKEGEEYALIGGNHPEHTDELNKMLTEKLGYSASVIFKPGASISINAGPELCGVGFYHK